MTSSDMLHELEGRCRQASGAIEMPNDPDTDATADMLAELACLPLLGVVQADLAARGFGFDLVPASSNPNPDDPTTVEAWVDVDRRRVRVGVPAQAKPGEVGLAAARMLAELQLTTVADQDLASVVFPRHLGSDPERDLATDAVMISFAVKLCARHGLDEPLVRRLKTLGRNIELKAVRGAMTEQASVEAAVLLWAYLTAVASPKDRTAVIGQVERVAPETALITQRLLARMKSPQTASKATKAIELLVATLKTPKSIGHAPDRATVERARERAKRSRSEHS